MILWGSYNRTRREEEGEFNCPACQRSTRFTVYRTYRYGHIYFIPLFRQETVAETIQCNDCHALYPITVLAAGAGSVPSSSAAAQSAGSTVHDNLGNVVTLTETAVAEVLRRHCAGRFGNDVVVRVLPPSARDDGYRVEFDFPLADGRDWIGESRGIPIVVDRRDAPLLLGKTLDFRSDRFCDATADRTGEPSSSAWRDVRASR